MEISHHFDFATIAAPELHIALRVSADPLPGMTILLAIMLILGLLGIVGGLGAVEIGSE